MKKYIFIILALFLASCQESELTSFNEPDAIYFQLIETDYSSSYQYWDDWLDSEEDYVVCDFGGLPASSIEKDTLWVQVNVLGRESASDRVFDVVYDDFNSTAEEGVHFEALKDDYFMPKDTVFTKIPFVIYNTDDLGSSPIILAAELKANENFELGLTGRTNVRVMIYSTLTKPTIWAAYYESYFGAYSEVKYKILIDLNQGKLLANDWTDVEPARVELGVNSYPLYLANTLKPAMNKYLKENEVYDENGNLIEPVS
ncbi:MAG: DUF4843 domain-containing protein [Mangrovibacterium sp.]